MVRKMIRQFRYLVIAPDMSFDLTYICSTCGYWLTQRTGILRDDIPNVVNDLVLDHCCVNCGEGNPRFVSTMLWSRRCGVLFDASVVRIMCDRVYLEEAYRNPCSVNICNCCKYYAFLVVSSSKRYPFVCAGCGKLYMNPTIILRVNSFEILHQVQINIFRDHFAEEFDFLTNTWKEPGNSHARQELKRTYGIPLHIDI